MYINEPFEPKIVKRIFQDATKLKRLKNPICFLGLPDQTDLGFKCAGYLIQDLKAEKLLTYYFNDFDSIIQVEEHDQLTELPRVEIYNAKSSSPINDIIIINGSEIPTSPIGVHHLSHKIAEFVSSIQPQIFLSLATFPISYPLEFRKTYLAYTSEELLSLFRIEKSTQQNKNLGLHLLQKGLVIGPSGLSITYANSLYDVKGGILMVEALEQVKVDLVAVKTALKILNEIFHLQLSPASLKIEESDYQNNFPKQLPSEDEILRTARRRVRN